MRTSGGPGVSGIRHYATGSDGRNCPTQARTRLEWATRLLVIAVTLEQILTCLREIERKLN